MDIRQGPNMEMNVNHCTENTDLVTFAGDILNGKLHILCSEYYHIWKTIFCVRSLDF